MNFFSFFFSVEREDWKTFGYVKSLLGFSVRFTRLRSFLPVDKDHVLIDPLPLHVLPMLEFLPRRLLQTAPVTPTASVDAVHEAPPARRATASPAPRVDRQREQPVLPQQGNGPVHRLEWQVAVSGAQSGANDDHVRASRESSRRIVCVGQIGGHVVVVDVWPIPQRRRPGRFEQIGADQSPYPRFLRELLAKFGADDAVAGRDVQNGQRTGERFRNGGGGKMLLQELHHDPRRIAC